MGQSDKEHGQPHEAPLPPRGENKPDMPPLLVALILKAGEEGHTMQHLAQSLGVSYARLNQWRRGESHIGQAQRSVHERAAKYLGMPGVVVQALAQNITLADFFWPEEGDLERRIGNGVEELFADKFLGGFVPPGLRDAEPSVKMFVLFLYRELNVPRYCGREHGSAGWFRHLREVLEQL